MKTIEIASTVSSVVTVTLSDAATMASGYTVDICNRSNFTATVTRATASDVIDNTAAAVSLLPLSAVGYKVNASANGYLTTRRGTAVVGGSVAGSSVPFVGMVNGTIVTSRSGNAETIAIKTLAGADPSASDPVSFVFRNATAGTGDYVFLQATAALSITISSGSTMGMTNSVLARLALVVFNDASTLRLGLVNPLTGMAPSALADDVLASSTAEGGAGAADSAQVIYTGTAVTTKAMRLLGYLEYTLATVGTWNTAPSKIQLFGPGVPLSNSTTITLGTPVASTSGTSVDFTGIPAWAKRITVNFNGVSTNGTNNWLIQIGDSGGVETSGYLGSAATLGAAANTSATANFTTGFGVFNNAGAATSVQHGSVTLILESSANNSWVASGVVTNSDSARVCATSGSKSVSPGPLDRVRITTVGGADTFDAGEINITYE